MSLEAAEHLPAESAPEFVRALTEAAPVVLFSAAVPNQPGTNHLNCQWPEYWNPLFERSGYTVIDELRRIVWDDKRVGWWYRQNIMIYVRRDRLASWPILESLHREGEIPRSLVHPELMAVWIEWGLEQSRNYWQLKEECRPNL
ncbi:MAG TPA: hypothetical protein VM053_04780 [Gemmatimonadaceae bacterium]|nr:hypothetical protein [Gemmatimonadaceae bacterium]